MDTDEEPFLRYGGLTNTFTHAIQHYNVDGIQVDKNNPWINTDLVQPRIYTIFIANYLLL